MPGHGSSISQIIGSIFKEAISLLKAISKTFSKLFLKDSYLYLAWHKSKTTVATAVVGTLVASGLAVIPIIGQAIDEPIKQIIFPTSSSNAEGFSTTEPRLISELSSVTPEVTGFTTETLRVSISAEAGQLSIDSSTQDGVGAVSGYEKSDSQELAFTGTQEQVNAAIATLGWQAEDLTQVKITINVSVGAGLSFEGHYYEVKEGPTEQCDYDYDLEQDVCENPIDWTDAYAAANEMEIPAATGVCPGYLVTINSQAEQNFISSKMKTDTWIGASDDPTVYASIGGTEAQSEGTWFWANGPEAGDIFMTEETTPVGDSYNNFAEGEPNNSGGDEDAAEMYISDAYWNDLAMVDTTLGSYIVEYGSEECTPSAVGTNLSAETFVQAGSVPTVVDKAFDANDFILNGNATATDSQIALTPNAGNKNGSLWAKQRICLSNNFSVESQVYLGAPGGLGTGADGLALVIQPLSVAAGGLGGGLGYAEITPSFAVEFDTWQNGNDPTGAAADPSGGHIALMENGATAKHNTWAAPYNVGTLGYGTQPLNSAFEDGSFRNFKFNWIAETQTVDVFVDLDHNGSYEEAEHLFSVPEIDLESKFSASEGCAYWGFTAATGGSANMQQVIINKYTATGRRNLPPVATIDNVNVDIAAVDDIVDIAAILEDDSTTDSQWTLNAKVTDSTVASITEESVADSTASLRVKGLAVGTTPLKFKALDADGLATSIKTVFLTVGEPGPSQPGNVVGTGGPGYIDLVWTAPTEPADTTFDDYEITYSSDDGAHWQTFVHAPSGGTSARISGLDADKEYVFKVKAKYTQGLVAKISPASLSEPISPVGSLEISNLSGVAGSKKVTLSWTPPTTNLTITNYVVEFRVAGTATWHSFSHSASTASSLDVTGLASGTTYEFRVTPIAGDVSGTPSSASAQYTPTGSSAGAGGSSGSTSTDDGSEQSGNGGSGSNEGNEGNGGSSSNEGTRNSNGPSNTNTVSTSEDKTAAEIGEYKVHLSPTLKANPGVIYSEQNPLPKVLTDLLAGPLAYELDSVTGFAKLPENKPQVLIAFENGVSVNATLINNATNTGFIIKADGWELEIKAQDSNGSYLKLDANGDIVLNPNRTIVFSGSGFAPGSYVQPWIFSSPFKLEKVLVGSNGTFTGKGFVPEGIEAGHHTIQVNGVSRDGQLRSAAIGVTVKTIAFAGGSAEFDWLMFNGFTILLLVLFAGIWFLISRRRREKGKDIISENVLLV